MRERLFPAVLSLTLLVACHRTPAPVTPAPPAPSPSTPAPSAPAPPSLEPPEQQPPTLQARVESLISEPSVSAGTWGIDVRSLRTNESLVSINPKRLLTPASSLKLITLAVAADQLGWDFTYQTRVVSTGRVEGGVLKGDLVVIGSGDPSLDDWEGAASTVFHTWASRLKDLGVSSIAGRIIGDGRAFSDEGFGAGWAWDDMAFSYSAPARGLQFNQSAALVVAAPGPAAGAPALVSIRPPYANLVMRADVQTTAEGSRQGLTARPNGRAPGVVVTGSVALNSRPISRPLAVPNPVRYYAAAVREGLRSGGIDVRGEAVDIVDLTNPPDIQAGEVLMTHRSPTLAELADTMMRFSQNLYAETLLRTLGSVRRGAGTAEAGRIAVQDTLAAWGIAASEVQSVDGSGLSRYNVLTPSAMSAVLAHVHADPRLRDAYIAALPKAGKTGTLVNRMKGTAAEGVVAAKTGSFLHARAIAGFAETADHEPLAFTIIANNYGVSPEFVDRISDAIILSLAEFTRSPERACCRR